MELVGRDLRLDWDGRVYIIYQDGHLAIRLADCHAVYRSSWRPHDGGERLDKKAISRLLRENMAPEGYVRHRNRLVTVENGRKRAVVIDLEKAGETLEVDGFTAGRNAPSAAS